MGSRAAYSLAVCMGGLVWSLEVLSNVLSTSTFLILMSLVNFANNKNGLKRISMKGEVTQMTYADMLFNITLPQCTGSQGQADGCYDSGGKSKAVTAGLVIGIVVVILFVICYVTCNLQESTGTPVSTVQTGSYGNLSKDRKKLADLKEQSVRIGGS